MTSRTWFVTGSGRGIGAAIARAALSAGDNVVATGRKVEGALFLQRIGCSSIPARVSAKRVGEGSCPHYSNVSNLKRLLAVTIHGDIATLSQHKLAD